MTMQGHQCVCATITPASSLYDRYKHLVSPKLPTALAHDARVDIPGYDIWLHGILNVHIVPTRLDVPTFEHALSATLQLYPHAAGQLRCSDGRWSIVATHTPVPLDIEHKNDTTPDALLNGNYVVQDDLSPFLSQRLISPFPVQTGDAHLLCLKLTLFEHETAIGISWHHALGDAIFLSRFMHTLSQLYQSSTPTYPPPTFDKHHFPAPTPALTAAFAPRLPHLLLSYSLDEIMPLYTDFLLHFQDLKWRIDEADLAHLRSALSARGNTYLSKHDCLSAYVTAALNQHAPRPVAMVTNISSYRHIHAPFIAETVAGNMIQNIPADVPADMIGIATALRRTIERCREPAYVHDAMTVTNAMMLDIANANKVFHTFLTDDTIVWANSNLAIDWCSAHFGCPEGSRFYTTGSSKHLLRTFRSNPVRGEDGGWRARSGVDVAMAVRVEVRARVLETLARGFEAVLESEATRV